MERRGLVRAQKKECRRAERKWHVRKMLMIKKEAPDDQSPCADLGDLKHQNLKKEQEEVSISLGGELLFEKEEVDAIRFPVTASAIKSEGHERSSMLSQLLPDQIKGTEIPEDNKGESIKKEDHGHGSISLKTEKVGDVEEYDVKHPTTSVMKNLSDTGFKIRAMDHDKKESRAPESDGNFRQFIYHDSVQKNLIHSDTGSSISQNNEQCFTEKKNLDSQKKVQTERTFDCEDCGKTFIGKKALKVHHRIHTPLKPFCCDLCEKKFALKSYLQKHMRNHTEHKPYLCDVCGKTLAHESSLNIHMQIHTRNKLFCCDVCNKLLSTKGNLIKHMGNHTGEKHYCCDVCGKRYGYKSSLKAHMAVHTRDKPICCDICNKVFSTKGNLKTHMRIHTGQKPYCCNLCYKRFTDKSTFNNHIICHTGEKPFCCIVCNKRFNRKSHVNVHMRTHTGNKSLL